MATQVKIWTMEGDFGIPKFYSKVKVFENETYASLRLRLEEKAALEWPFEFWDNEDRCRIRQKMEALNDVVGDIFVLPVRSKGEEAASKRRRLDNVVVPSQTGEEDGFVAVANEEEGGVQAVHEVGNSRVTGTSAVTDSLDHQLHSTLISKKVWERYLEQSEKMKRDLKCSSLEDNRWLLKTIDFNGNGIVKIYCIECHKQVGGKSGKHDKTNIQNLFNNFRSKHLLM